MSENHPIKGQEWVRTVIGAVLSLSSLPFFWKGVNTVGTVEIKSQALSATLSTSSAGFALLIGGLFLMLASIPRLADKEKSASPSRGTMHTIISIVFYISLSLMPLILYCSLLLYLKKEYPDLLMAMLPMVSIVLMITAALVGLWGVPSVQKILTGVQKREKGTVIHNDIFEA